MKVGYTFIQLAWAAIAPAQAVKFMFLLIVWLSVGWKSTAANPPTDLPIVVPIQLVGKSVFVEATVNGQTGHYLFDTGASDLILNSAHLTETTVQSHGGKIIGINGNIQSASEVWAADIVLGNLHLGQSFAMALDLSAMEKIKHMPVAGIIGYNVLKNVEWRLDFDRMELTLLPFLDGNQSAMLSIFPPTDSFEFKMSGHIPYLNIKLGGKRLRMGLDTGSERNLVQIGATDERHFQQRGRVRLAGLSDEAAHLRAGFLMNFSLGSLQADSLEVVLTDLQQVGTELPVQLDGILGIAFLRQYKVAINYQRSKVYFWRQQMEVVTEGYITMCYISD